jgi:hypothetical protein
MKMDGDLLLLLSLLIYCLFIIYAAYDMERYNRKYYKRRHKLEGWQSGNATVLKTDDNVCNVRCEGSNPSPSAKRI